MRHDFALGVPDLAAFPRAAWLRAMRRVLSDLPDAGLGHPDPRGTPTLRNALAAYLGRQRGVVTTADRIVITNGFWQALGLVCAVLVARGAKRLAMEDPGFVYHRHIAKRAGLEIVPVPVDDDALAAHLLAQTGAAAYHRHIAKRAGLEIVPVEVDAAGMRVDLLAQTDADAALVTPAHQSPTGVVMGPERRTALLGWAHESGAILIEDDYDAEHRYDREPVGALQGHAPERVVYGGTASKTLAPALRLGWVAVPADLAHAVAFEKGLADGGSPVLEQLVLADMIESGELDRHLRRTRAAHRGRRAALQAAVEEHLPGCRLHGAPAALPAQLDLPAGTDEHAVVEAAARRGVRVEALAPHRFAHDGARPGLLL